MIQETTAAQVEPTLKLLSLDGGGIRGLSSLYLLKQLMETLDSEHPPKPCNWFDMIGGTSTGGLIAIMLGRLEMDIDSCIEAYIAMSDRIFKKKRHRLGLKGDIQGRFDTVELENSIKKIIVDAKQPPLDVDETMRPEIQVPGACKIFVCAASGAARDIVQFSSYKRDMEAMSGLFNKVKIWEAARATSAASTFFEPIKIGPDEQPFLDGATGANNPVNQVWREANRVWGSKGIPLAQQVRCVVSIGTGVPSVKAFGTNLLQVANTLKDMATQTEETADSFLQDHSELLDPCRYFRFNVQHGLESVGLEEASKRGLISEMTRRYGALADTQGQLTIFRTCARGFHNVKRRRIDCDPTVAPIVATIHVVPTSFAFDNLDSSPKYVGKQHGAWSYWGYLTSAALEVYEAIYDKCKDPTGYVSYEAFAHQFTSSHVSPALVQTAWQRLAKPNMALKHNYVLAAIYMIHVERVHPNKTLAPRPFSDRRWRILDQYGDWVKCGCGCDTSWSFANGEYGMQRDVNEKRKKCRVQCWRDAGRLGKLRWSDGERYYEDIRRRWHRLN